ncbi:MAG: hypothetical protein NZ602_12000 [Thermoguttaceae bacterium]|nr:hypothetical protein [Thermoguttaceae bacterium]
MAIVYFPTFKDEVNKMGKLLALLMGCLVVGEENDGDWLSRIRKLYDEKTWEQVRSIYEDPQYFRMIQKIDLDKIGTFPQESAEKFRKERAEKKRPLFRGEDDSLDLPDEGELFSPKKIVNQEKYRFSLRGKVQMVQGSLPSSPEMLTLCILGPWDPKDPDLCDCDSAGNFSTHLLAITPQGDYYQVQPGDKVWIYPMNEGCFAKKSSVKYFYYGYAAIPLQKEKIEATLLLKTVEVKRKTLKVVDQFDKPLSGRWLVFQPSIPMGEDKEAPVWTNLRIPNRKTGQDGTVSFSYVDVPSAKYRWKMIDYISEENDCLYTGAIEFSPKELAGPDPIVWRISGIPPSLVVHVKWDEAVGLGEFRGIPKNEPLPIAAPYIVQIYPKERLVRYTKDSVEYTIRKGPLAMSHISPEGKLLFHRIPPGEYTLEFLPEGRKFRPTKGSEYINIPSGQCKPVIHVMTVEPIKGSSLRKEENISGSSLEGFTSPKSLETSSHFSPKAIPFPSSGNNIFLLENVMHISIVTLVLLSGGGLVGWMAARRKKKGLG